MLTEYQLESRERIEAEAGVARVETSVPDRRVTVGYDPAQTDPLRLAAEV